LLARGVPGVHQVPTQRRWRMHWTVEARPRPPREGDDVHEARARRSDAAILPDGEFLLKLASHVDLRKMAGRLGLCSMPALQAPGLGLCRRRCLLAPDLVRQ